LLNTLVPPSASTLTRFLRAWYGDPRSDPGTSEPEVPAFVPDPLRAFYRAADRWPEAVVQNRLLAPDELRCERGRFVFYVENQATYLWATEPSVEDPPVWGVENEPDVRWQKEDERLSRFLVQVALFEAVMGAEIMASAAWLDPPRLRELLAGLPELPFAPWRWPDYPTRFYAREGVLALVMPNRTPESPDYVSVQIAARDEAALRFLQPYIDDAWEITPWD
jgi:hypothetical protein